MTPLTARPAAEFDSATLANALNAAFAAYVVPITFTAQTLDARLRPEHLDPHASQLFFDGRELVGAAMVARRGWTARLAAMGVAQTARGRGVGRAMLTHLIADARARRDRAFTLEVIEHNAPAVRLYERAGFHTTGRLVGYTRPAADAPPRAPLVEVDPLHVARLVTRHADTELPWMLAGETLSGFTAPARGVTVDGSAHALITPYPQVTVLHALITPPEQRRRGHARTLLNALQAHHGHLPLRIIPVVPEDLAAPFAARAGFVRDDLTQLHMTLPLTP
ncbi:GNAT family N-acetyltransferase [Deinococcus maricopensis]|uniref:GCN5-related N-acetyltransferase n=1 Tax=Deinococcus maricopensis (strain DSM 21211 / LMG 22137 / NRRL B-23946 / LB-34) TaxID=709986 RepID=E8UA93_DEIML|nr:GNAT family N-acetyltransferase [Deinococcus maricopensis]ADV67982.1 GCN5-related N-acetyltransferase [Deinococcus maricopensis DSM 21211]